jgi:hypothetical protein
MIMVAAELEGWSHREADRETEAERERVLGHPSSWVDSGPRVRKGPVIVPLWLSRWPWVKDPSVSSED